ncbi:MAG: OmpA family protein [Opitutaceae bacterium]|nr:OmpA family protein [Opitutaceae bacterium]
MISKKSILYFLIIAVAVGFSGCKKKPRRPSPIDTAHLGGGAGSGSGDQFENLNDDNLFDNPDDVIGSRVISDGQVGDPDVIRVIVYFDFDSAGIKVSERAKIAQAADHMRSHPGDLLILEGHCDWKGTPEYNLALGERRSSSVKQYMETLGIASSSLETLSKGDLNAVEGAASDQMSKDRRVVFLVVR